MAEQPKQPKPEKRGCSTTLLPLLTFLLGLVCGLAWGQNPSSELKAALADARIRPRTTRYLSLYNTPVAERASTVAVLGYTLNAISRSAIVSAPIQVTDTLWRFDLDQYRLPATAWESLASANEPYFHLTAKVINPQTGKVDTVYSDAGHVDLNDAASLRFLTGSGGAILRADWFLAKALQPPHYYDLAGTPKTEKEWLAAGGTDDKTVIDLRANKGSSIFRSGVTNKPRRISRRQTITGANWITRDSVEGDTLKHPLRVPGFALKADAAEAMATKPNGLLAYALFNAKGELIGEVPPEIAKDSTAHDGRLLAPVSCLRCHTDSGYKVFANDFADMLKSTADLHLPADELDQLASFYADTERLAVLLKRDQEDYAAGVAKATGGKLTAATLPKAVAATFSGYVDDQVGIDEAKRELGVESLDGFKASNDPVLLAILAGVKVNRADWELSFSGAALLTK